METSLTVKEADRMLSELAGGGTPFRGKARAGRCAIRSPADKRPSSTNPVPLPNSIRPRRSLPHSPSQLVGDRLPHHLGPLDDQLCRPILL